METIRRRTPANPHGVIAENFVYNSQDGLRPQGQAQSGISLVIMQQLEDVPVTISEDDFLVLIDSINFQDIDPESKCTICQQSYTEDDDIVNLNSCNHVFHHDCIRTLLTEFNTHCPSCRSDVRDYLNEIDDATAAVAAVATATATDTAIAVNDDTANSSMTSTHS
jgi:hypothetical protein